MKQLDDLKDQYDDTVKKYSPKNQVGRNCFRAFWVGGSFCVLGQAITNGCISLGFSEPKAGTLATIALILISAILTAFNIYDKIGNYAGAGSIIPITGFANAMVSAAMEYKKEGYIFGMGSKIFTIAGPVIVFGTIASVIVGIIYYLI